MNLRVLEQRLNKIQEESTTTTTTNNKSEDPNKEEEEEDQDEEEEEEEGEVEDEDDLETGDLSDDPSTLPEDEPNFVPNQVCRERNHEDFPRLRESRREKANSPALLLTSVYLLYV